MPGEWNPASVPGELAWVAGLVRELQGLRAEVQALRQEQRTYAQDATVSAYTGGSKTCTVQFASGATLVVGLMVGYAPAVGHSVKVLISPFGDVVLGRNA